LLKLTKYPLNIRDVVDNKSTLLGRFIAYLNGCMEGKTFDLSSEIRLRLKSRDCSFTYVKPGIKFVSNDPKMNKVMELRIPLSQVSIVTLKDVADKIAKFC
jgi:hypothetical protein